MTEQRVIFELRRLRDFLTANRDGDRETRIKGAMIAASMIGVLEAYRAADGLCDIDEASEEFHASIQAIRRSLETSDAQA